MDQRYHDYINASPRWHCIRALVLLRDRGQCRRCGTGRDVIVHHADYRTLYRETGTELLVMCRPCHNYLHKVGRWRCPEHERLPVIRTAEQLDRWLAAPGVRPYHESAHLCAHEEVA